MIVVRLMGGLGNQMFQYAAGLSLAEHLKTTVELDLGWFNSIKDTDTARFYELNNFNFYQHIFDSKKYTLDTDGTLKKALGFYRRRLHFYKEPNFSFDKKFFELKDNFLLQGYFQSEKYFINIRQKLLDDFKIKGKISNKSMEVIKMINRSDSVSLHVRRGDYVSNKSANQFHGLMGEAYYKKAIKMINKSLKNPKYFIFSDEIDWVKHNLDLPKDSIYITHNKSGIEDMRIMTYCKHNIIANSSFSWWGAWLGTNQNKIVIAPEVWFLDDSIDTSDIIPSRWQRI